jgi:RNA polymerase sigma-70 factor (ECF subfamily)
MVSRDSNSRKLVNPDGQDPDVARMAGIRDGDPAALDALMADHWARLVAYAGKLLGSTDGAEDVVQETFVRVWYRRADFQLSGSVRCYLYRIVRNLIRDEARRQKVRSRWAASAGIERVFPAPPDQLLENHELRRVVERGIQELSPRRREVFVLAHLHDLTYQQIGELMAISPQTVANHMSAALADLRDALQPFLSASTSSTGRTPGDRSEHFSRPASSRL